MTQAADWRRWALYAVGISVHIDWAMCQTGLPGIPISVDVSRSSDALLKTARANGKSEW